MANDEESTNLNRVTESGGGETIAVDAQAAKQASDQAKIAMQQLQNKMMETQRREKELNERLAKVEIVKEDVAELAKEFDISKTKAERKLRENDGDYVKAAKELIYS